MSLPANRAARVLFLGLMYAGHRTRFLNLKTHTEADPRIVATYKQVTGWVQGGTFERLPLLPHRVKGRLRATLEAAAVAQIPRPDVIWTSVSEVLTPHLWAQVGALRRPMVFDLDCTFDQLETLAPTYYGRPSRTGAQLQLARWMEHLLCSRTSLFTPWSRWAADGLRALGVPEERIHVLPPGIDLDLWRPAPRKPTAPERPLRLLFVGGDFARKGGPLLVELLRDRFAGRYELDIVTHASVPNETGIRVHRAEPNSATLRNLYARADLFVLPSHAECFGLATIEAMAAGLPALVSDRGGARDIVDPDQTGWLVEPTAEALGDALERALARRDELPHLGARARQVAEQRFNGRTNDLHLLDLLLEQAQRFRGRAATS